VPEELTRYRVHAGNTPQASVLASGIAVLDGLYRDPEVTAVARCPYVRALALLHWYHASAARPAGRRAALRLATRALSIAPASVLTRPALGALARIVGR
jgi:hypothetical protein